MLTRSFTAALALAATGLVFAPAVSAAEDFRTVGVTHTDLDLTTEDGKAELERRIDRASKQVCGMDEAQVGTLLQTRQQRRCYRETKREFDRHFAEVIEDAQRGG
ncbi:UrcA family protein [Aurantiacibacter sp. MUD11]|uniref:UrcA family protein n=1 Tax=Aurantiacibacter sp. MUD11 TaxID=3003265 RepID=UPI0022AA5B0D|nr:UrcA family protein [Aurantiacibacter sp. MUD11]WAT17170.1 UrcA family protein [Aurantiacibacter sp. MUD11]